MGIVASAGLTVTDVNDGITARLTNDTFVAGAENDGTSPNLTGVATTMSIFIGTTDDSANWTAAATPSSGVSGALVGKTYTVSGFTLDAGYVDFTASRNGYSSVTARFTLSKSKKGKRGSVTTARPISGSVWSDGEAASAITAAISGTPEAADTVTLYNSASGYTETKVHTSGGTWLTLTAFFGGDVIVDGTLHADKIEAGSMTVDRMAIGSFYNLLENPNFERGQAEWTNPSRIVNDPVNAARGNWVATYVSPSSANNIVCQSNYVEAQAGDSFHVRGKMKLSAGSTGNYYIMARFYNDANTTISSVNLIWTGADTAYVEREMLVTVPASATKMAILLYTAGVGTAYWDEISLIKAVDGKLIVDGDITAEKIGAGEINAIHIASESITADKLVVGDRSNMVHDPLFDDIASWVAGGGATLTVSTGNITTWGQDKVLNITGLAASYSSARSKAFIVEPGDVLLFSAKAELVTGTPVNNSAYITISTSPDGVTFTQVSVAGLLVGNLAGGTPSDISGRYTVPAGVRYARLTLLKTGVGSVTAVKFSIPRVRFKTVAGLLDYPSLAVEGLAVFGDSIQSDDYVVNSSGWKIHKNGTIEAENLRLTSKNMTIDLDTMPQAWAKQSCVVVAVSDFVAYGLMTIDGVALVAGDRVLRVGQTAAGENGIFNVVAGNYWTRAIDADTGSKIAGAVVSINKGTTYSGTHWITDIKSNATIGTTPMNWGQMLHDESIIPNTMISGLGDLSTRDSIDLTFLPTAWVKQDVVVATNEDVAIALGFSAMDGYTPAGGDRVLLMGQTNPAENGIYIAPSGVGTYVRTTDFNSAGEAAGAVVAVSRGSAFGGKQFACKFKSNQTFGTDAILWEEVLTASYVSALAKDQTPNLTYFPESGFKEICRLCSDTNITVAYTGAISVDGLPIAANDRILLIGQTDPAENGIWLGQPSAAWVRASDANANNHLFGATVAVFRGAVYGGKQFITDWKFGATLGTTAMNWYQTLNTNSTLTSSKLSGLLGSTVIPAFTGGDVTSPGGSLVLSIGVNKVTLDMMAQVATATLLGRTTAGTGNIEALTAAQGRTVLGLGALATLGSVSLTTQATGVLQAAQAPAHTGDVTSSAGSLALTIGVNAVTNAKSAQMATKTIKGNDSGSTANPADLTIAQVMAMLGLFNPMLIPASGHDVACCLDGAAASTTLAGAANRCDIYQFFAGKSFTASGVKCSISTGVAANNVKLVLYGTDATGRPTALLGETADISGAVAGIVGGVFTIGNVNIVQGQMYFVGIRCNGTASYNTWAAGSVPRLNAGVASTAQRCIFRRTITYASVAPSSWNYAAGEINTGNAPALWLTVA